MTRNPTKNTKQKRSDPRELSRFVEELSWLLKTFENIDYDALSSLSHEMEFFFSNSQRLRKRDGVSRNTAILVGILPDFLMDSSLFPTNEGIVEFADAALGLPISRWQKKSKYEIIGQIVCHTNDASPNKVRLLSEVIEEMLDSKTSLRRAIEANRDNGQSWGEVIRHLYNDF
ncbi:hypothetical protein [Sulfitobacter sp. R18_1]|uniref:hypothetical protein n=1 Tax=Sulfitobacter sp. R18_1 TaxID=2821104 RepID=UPI001ADB0BD1|nr:hypothetical protein [Sulfitobacter sp. R18_1]MBO9429682.1 hypothetical protein [Sulfitobacter sp. R18_1]